MPRTRVLVRRLLRKLALGGGVAVAAVGLRLLRKTWHIEHEGAEPFSLAPAIVAFWHGDLLVGASEIMAMGRGSFGTLASQSRDGEVAAALARWAGVTPLRGGSSRGQIQALRAMERWLRQGHSLVVAVDGPRGPRGAVKSGVILLASSTGVPIVPAAAVGLDSRAWRFRSWDGMWLPKMGARVRVIFSSPIHVPASISKEALETHRCALERILFELHGEPAPGARGSMQSAGGDRI